MANGGGTLFDQLSNPDHPLRQREWETFLSRRQFLIDDLVEKLGLTVGTHGMNFDFDPVEYVDGAGLRESIERREQLNQAGTGLPPGMRQRDYHQRFIGPAKHYGIENPEEIPLGDLEQMLEERRVRAREDGFANDDLTTPQRIIQTYSGVMGLGAVDALVRTAETIPFMGRAMSERKGVQNVNQWIGEMREAHTQHLSEAELQGALVVETLGGLAGYVPTGILGWKLAGAALAARGIGGITRASTQIIGNRIVQSGPEMWGLMATNPILHRSIQGGLATVFLEAGGDGPIHEKILNITLGTGLGAAFEVGGKVGVGAFGVVGGGIAGASIDRPVEGAFAGLAAALGARRAFTAFSRSNGVNAGKHSTWHEPLDPITGEHTPPPRPGGPSGPRGFEAGEGVIWDVWPDALTPPGHPRRAPAIPEHPMGLPPGSDPRLLPPGRTQGGGLPEAPTLTQLPAEGVVTEAINRYTVGGRRTLFYAGNETPDELVRSWGTLTSRGYAEAGEPFVNSIPLDNTGRIIPGAKNVYEVEVDFDNLFVLTPESVGVFRNLVRDAPDLPQMQTRLRDLGFDGLAVQGIDDLLEQFGPELVAQQLGVPTSLLGDQVLAFGRPAQVRLSKPVVDGDALEYVFHTYGSDAGRKVAGIQATTLSREAAAVLRPFDVGEAAEFKAEAPEWLSQQKGVRFVRAEDAPKHEFVPAEIESAVMQNHERFGPRILLLDGDRIARATLPVSGWEEGSQTLFRMGFTEMNPNSAEEGRLLGAMMANTEKFVNSRFADVFADTPNPSLLESIAIAYAENPGRLSVVTGDESIRGTASDLKKVFQKTGRTTANPEENVAFTRRDGLTHALVGPKDLLTPKAVKQFEEFGMFSGMEVSTANGNSARVNSIWREKDGRVRASISPLYSDIKATVPADYLIPGDRSAAIPLAGKVYDKFKGFALKEFNAEAKRAGLEPATTIADHRVMSHIDQYIDDFATANGITSGYEIERFAGSLEWNLAKEMQRMAGKDGEFFFELSRTHADEITKATLRDELIVPDLPELAIQRGFIWEPAWRGKPGQLVDQNSNTVIPFDTEESAMAFLKYHTRSQQELGAKDWESFAPFQGFDGFAAKGPRGIEFTSEAAERASLEGTIQRISDDLDRATANGEYAAEVLDWVDRVYPPEAPPPFDPQFARTEIPGAATPEGTTPPPFDPSFARMDFGAGGAGTPPPPPPGGTGGTTPPPPPPPPPPPRSGPGASRERSETEQFLNEMRQRFDARKHPEAIKELSDFMNRLGIKATAPMRIAAQIFDEYFVAQGISRPRVFSLMDDLLQKKGIAVNETQPWLNEMWDIVGRFPRGWRRNGPLYEAMSASTAPDPNLHARTGYTSQREAVMGKYGFNEDQRAAVEELRNLMDRLHMEATGFSDIGYIFDYMPKLRHYMDLHGERGFHRWEQMLPKDLQWFALYTRKAGLENYHKDVGRVLETYVRGLHFEKNVRVPYEKMRATFLQEGVPAPLYDYVENFLYVVRFGHPEGHDALVRSATASMNHLFEAANKTFGTPNLKVTESEVLSAFGFFSTLQYRGLLGNVPSTILRELFQPMLLAGEIGVVPMIRAYSKFLTNPQVRQEWTERAMRHGWAEQHRNAVANTEFFTGELRNVAGKQGFKADVAEARESVARFFDKVYDRSPQAIKNGIEDNPYLNPLYSYRKFATNPGRIIAGNAGYEHAMEAIQRWQAGQIDFDQMLRASNAGQKGYSIRQEFIESIQAGDLEKAAARMGTEGSGTQFHFGLAEQSEWLRNAGMAGRLAMQFGNFANQFAWRTAREFKNRDTVGKLSYAARIGGLAFLPGIVGMQLGWDRANRYNWFGSLMFAGGTMVDPIINSLYSFSALRKIIAEEPLSPEEQFMLGRWGDVVGNIPVNPYGSTMRTIEGFVEAMQSPTPAEAMFQFTITGGRAHAAGERFQRDFLEFTREQGEIFRQPQTGTPTLQGGRAGEMFQHGVTPAEQDSLNEMVEGFLQGGGSMQ